MSEETTVFTAMTFPTSEESFLADDKTQAIIDALCDARDTEIKHDFDTYGGVIIDESMWRRACSTATKVIYGEDTPEYGDEYKIVKQVYTIARHEGRLYSKLRMS